jgi:uncharacterized protein (TIGR02594 family)
MFTRRSVFLAAAAAALPISIDRVCAQESDEELLAPLDYPSIDALTQPHEFGLRLPDKSAIDKANAIIANTPTGPTPFEVAKSFVTRFGKSDPDAISQWPLPAAWNPLVVDFFSATQDKATNDTVPWCAAFTNWCLLRSHRPTTNSASSQSFATTDRFKTTSSPKQGDIVVFTCYTAQGNSDLGIGHVTFFDSPIDSDHILCLGGNQGGDRSSTISERAYPNTPFKSKRHVNGKYVNVVYRINRYLTVV